VRVTLDTEAFLSAFDASVLCMQLQRQCNEVSWSHGFVHGFDVRQSLLRTSPASHELL